MVPICLWDPEVIVAVLNICYVAFWSLVILPLSDTIHLHLSGPNNTYPVTAVAEDQKKDCATDMFFVLWPQWSIFLSKFSNDI